MRSLPRHRWFYFPHSFDPKLVDTILDYWRVRKGARLVDPFVGSGTSLVVARGRGVSALGLDTSPLSVLASNVKAREYDSGRLRAALAEVVNTATAVADAAHVPPDSSHRLKRAFTDAELKILLSLKTAIQGLELNERDFLMLALLSTARRYSRAVADGGWFRWREWPSNADEIVPSFREQAQVMIKDAAVATNHSPPPIEARLGDARTGLRALSGYSASVTSPPYPNRHDYTRVFHIELLLLGQSEAEIFALRRSSMRSHVEARREQDNTVQGLTYQRPDTLQEVIDQWPADVDRRDPRVRAMVEGYFEDLYETLVGLSGALEIEGRVALVLGNVQHAGVAVPVDEICAELGGLAGLVHTGTWVIRERGNSAQQMGAFGRRPSRESVVFFRRVA